MKMNLKTVALIYSINQPAEVTIKEMVGNNKYLAEYEGNLCAAMFNPFVGMYYVDDVNGRITDKVAENMDNVQYELGYLSQSCQRELNAYRSLGSYKHLKHLRQQELTRIKRWNFIKKTVKATIVSSGVILCLWILISGVMSIIA